MQIKSYSPNRKNINYIVENDLCIRCGACVGVCPYDDVISFGDSYFPVINDKCYTHPTCTVCVKVCPVSDINLPILYQAVHGRKVDLNEDYLGPFRELYVGHSTFQEIRERGSSGGVVTQLLVSLLESGRIDGAIVAASDTEGGKPWNAKGILATTTEEIINSAGSKYTIAPVNEQLKALRNFDGRIALVGLPCHIQSYRMWESISNRIRDRVGLTIGVLCSLTLNMEAITDLIQVSGVPLAEVEEFEYRTGEWPGRARVKKTDGELVHLRGVNMIEAFRHLSKFYYPEGCLNCVDYGADLADISIGDPWLRGPDGEHLYKEGWSVVAVRTEKGTEAIEAVTRRGDLVLRKIAPDLWIQNQERMGRTKRRRALYRIKGLEQKGKVIPNYHLNDITFSLHERLRRYLFQKVLGVAKTKLFRQVFVRFMCTTLGEMMTRVKKRMKSWRWRYKYGNGLGKGKREQETLIETHVSLTDQEDTLIDNGNIKLLTDELRVTTRYDTK